ncbi:hypothetical protein P152DRAFT_453526 [Eremomyces bilateralis CBS 781.70]|uniref:Transcriptional regulatory protein RXT2 N-terminal domain-containing protein n=1 Tax=Eremomyces bilateralis CBS 781.70 TaxID=1392243 RepID=A0A6G1GFQ7_9PEZI|nr:uncharacterized protein P152DRAFT_453526 [Eremomyces bilateralis CBS 781.70]KAF1816917.1 hypothetical protein P152DRAFT_453526 [Eremomyces bilateralis CBS 781.70]
MSTELSEGYNGQISIIILTVSTDSESDDSIVLATNRGNKLKRKAKYVQEGKLDNPNGPATQKKRIRYAGYDRSIISRNPPRFDEYGDIIETDDDEDYDARDNEDNTYKDTRIEVILGPLTAASDLPTHPGLSIPYKSAALPEMVTAAEESLHKEQETLWRMKNLLTNLRGDSGWVPVGAVQSDYDEWLLNTITNGAEDEQPDVMALIWGPIANGGAGSPLKALPEPTGDEERMDVDLPQETVAGAADEPMQTTNGSPPEPRAPNGVAAAPPSQNLIIEELEAAATGATTNGAVDHAPQTAIAEGDAPAPDAEQDDNAADEADADGEPSQPPHRMTTRARAHRTSRSPSSNPSLPPFVHPFFEFNATAIPGFDAGLPTNEAHDVRAFLVSYVSKQEEVVRGTSKLYHGLLKALRMRKTVWKWCRTEGHVGEMSDGEDWYDREEWGLEEDLVKGKEEEDEEVTNQKKTRRRGDR